jgi:myo-inositol-1-phosphate synthase
MLVEQFKVESPNVQYADDSITSTYTYTHTEVERTDEGKWKVAPKATEYTFKTDTRVPKLGCVGPAAGLRTVPAGPVEQP